MAKKNIGKNFNVYPMPVVMVGTTTDGKPNFMTAAWVSRVNTEPPLVAVSMGLRQHTAKGIQQTRQFSVNVPSVDQAELVDYCGLVHGYQVDKSAHVDIFRGSLESAPMVRECPLTAECRLVQTVELPKDYLFIGEVAGVYATEAIMTDGQIDVTKLRPFVLTMPDNSYWSLGERVGDAWSIGRALIKSEQ